MRIEATVESPDWSVDGCYATKLLRPDPSEGSRFRQDFETITGRKIEDGMDIDPSEMLEKRVRIVVQNHQNGEGRYLPRIVDFEPLD